MAADNFESCLALTLRFEGGYSDHPADPGGATNMGVTRATLALARGRPVSKAEVRALTRAEAAEIYKARFWHPVGGDLLAPGLDAAVFDYAVNSGPARASRALQQILGVGAEEGVGPRTLAALAKAEPRKIIWTLSRAREGFLERLRTFRVFGRGWRARVDAVEVAALDMARRAGAHIST